ncbi:hypothetical protein ATR1_116c0001, partial [Acetobacter tropicalis]
ELMLQIYRFVAPEEKSILGGGDQQAMLRGGPVCASAPY